MKKLLLTFSLLGLFALLGSIDANAKMQDDPEGLARTYPATYVICDHYCFCYSQADYDYWEELYCS